MDSGSRTAFDEMRRAQRVADGHIEPQHDDAGHIMLCAAECHFTKEAGMTPNGEEQLTIDLYKHLQRLGLGWLNELQANTLGVPMVKALAGVLWEITDHWKKLADAHCRPPAHWDSFAGRRQLTHRAQRIVDIDRLEAKLVSLEQEIDQLWWSAAPTWASNWGDFCQAADELRTCLNKFMKRTADKRAHVYTHRNKAAPVLVRSRQYDMYPIVRARVPSDQSLNSSLSLLAANLGATIPSMPIDFPIRQRICVLYSIKTMLICDCAVN